MKVSRSPSTKRIMVSGDPRERGRGRGGVNLKGEGEKSGVDQRDGDYRVVMNKGE